MNGTRTGFTAATALVAAILIGLLAPAAGAHTAFESAEPAPGSVVDHPVDRIVITYTGEATEAGEGFVVLRPDGVVVEPVVTRGDDGRQFSLLLDPPLTGGEVGVRWTVRAGDAHPIDGSFSFTTTAPAPTPTSVPTVAPSPTSAPTALPTSEPAAAVDATATGAPEATTAPTTTAMPAPLETPIPDVSTAPSDVDIAAVPVTLDEFLETDGGFDPGRPFGWIGRPFSVVGALVTLGLLLFHLLTLRRPVGEITSLANVLLVATGALLVGGVAEGVALVVGDAGAGLGSSAGLAALLRIGGAGVIAAVVLSSRNNRRVGPLGPAVGAAAVLGSWAFDGHTVTEGNRVLTAVLDLVHVAGGAVWVGGVIGLLLVWEKHRLAVPTWVVRFSVVASVTVAVVGLAGSALTITIIDDVSDLWSTTWGRTLLAKVTFAAVVGAAGAYNHFVFVPQFLGGDVDRSLHRMWNVLRLEAIALLAVALLTGGLIAASAS